MSWCEHNKAKLSTATMIKTAQGRYKVLKQFVRINALVNEALNLVYNRLAVS